MYGIFKAISISVLLVAAGCSSRVHGIAEFNDWLNKPEHGCISDKRIAGIKIVVKYLPPAYMALKKLERLQPKNSETGDSILETENHIASFLMTIGPDADAGEGKKISSAAYEGTRNYHEYAQRFLEMNFFMEKYVKLYADGQLYNAVFAVVDNVYELSDNRSFILTFILKKVNGLKDKRECVFVYEDPFFNLGKVQFNFLGVDLQGARDVCVDWN